MPAADDGPEVVANLRSVGLEHTQDALKAAGYTSMARLGESSCEELVAANLKPVHARLIVSNLDSQSTAAAATPQRSMSGVDDEVLSSRTALLGGGAQKPPPRSKGSVAKVVLCLACLIGALLAGWAALNVLQPPAAFSPPMLRAPHKKSGGATSCPACAPHKKSGAKLAGGLRAPRKAKLPGAPPPVSGGVGIIFTSKRRL